MAGVAGDFADLGGSGIVVQLLADALDDDVLRGAPVPADAGAPGLAADASPGGLPGRGSAASGEKDAGAAPVPAEYRPLAVFTLSGRELLLAAASQVSAGGQAVALVILLGNWLNNLVEWGALDLEGAGGELVAAATPELIPLVLL